MQDLQLHLRLDTHNSGTDLRSLDSQHPCIIKFAMIERELSSFSLTLSRKGSHQAQDDNFLNNNMLHALHKRVHGIVLGTSLTALSVEPAYSESAFALTMGLPVSATRLDATSSANVSFARGPESTTELWTASRMAEHGFRNAPRVGHAIQP